MNMALGGGPGGGDAASIDFALPAPTGTSSLTAVMQGLGSAVQYTPVRTGKVEVTFTGDITTLVATTGVFMAPAYGPVTSGVPANGAAFTGTVFGLSTGVTLMQLRSPGVGQGDAFAFSAILALTPGITYWFDLQLATGNAADEAEIINVHCTVKELVT